MTSLSEIPVLRGSSPPESTAADSSAETAIGTWSPVELPPARRPSPLVLVVLALLTGIAAMALGALAVLSATKSADDGAAIAAATAPIVSAGVERRVLSLLAKPSTARVVFRGTGGRLVLAVGTGGRAAILVRGFERAPAGQPYSAWVVRSGGPVRAARFTGAERAVLLSAPVGRGQSVVVARERPTRLRSGAQGIAAVRP